MINKNIVLCSDGTGNKGGYGSDSNVYKTYKAVDVTTGKANQYTFYDQGVGTDKSDNSKNKYLTALSGAFGFGFQQNVLHLYHFLARSYEPGDKIFLFGFSRGAATVRAFAGFLNACGLVDKQHAYTSGGSFNSEKFEELVLRALDCYRSEDKNQQAAFKQQYAVKHPEHAPEGELQIHFVGVWDTVSALGFPEDFSVLLQGLGRFADWATDQIPALKHHFYDYELNNSILHAYHALALDDERQTFRPKVWDETRFNNHVEQVWFAGVHSNVGGGYPRTGMSDVALVWMLEKAVAHGLELYDDVLTTYRENANVYDRLYDSRDGLALYYRYGPRNLEKLCAGKLKQNKNIAIHISAYRKLKEFSEAYAPDGIPALFDVVDIDPNHPELPKQVLAVDVAAEGHIGSWRELGEAADRLIANRQKLYFLFSELTMAIILISIWFWKWPPEVVTNWQSSGLLGLIGDGIRYVTPACFENFITYVVEVHPVIVVVMVAILLAIRHQRNSLIDRLDQVCRLMVDLLPSREDTKNQGDNS